MVLTIGTFDLLHYGHIDFLKRCERMGRLIVGVNSDRFVQAFKPKAVMDQDERMYAMQQRWYEVKLNDGPGKELIETVDPDILAVGSDWARKDYLKQIGVDQDWLDEHNITLAYVPYVQARPISTTEIKRRIKEGV